MSWSAQHRCGTPLLWRVGCGPSPSGCCSRRDLPGPVQRCAHGAGDAQERTRMAEVVGPGDPDDGSGAAGPMSVLVVIPTYNERDNIEPLLTRLHAAVPDADALVVDDGS